MAKQELAKVEPLDLAGFDPKGDVTGAIAEIDKKISELKSVTESNWKTPGKVDGFKNFKDMSTLEEIHEALSVAIAKEAAYNKAQELTGVKTVKAKTFEGATVADLVEDAKVRAAQIQYGKQLDALQNAKKVLSEFVTKEQRQAIAVQGVLDSLKGLF